MKMLGDLIAFLMARDMGKVSYTDESLQELITGIWFKPSPWTFISFYLFNLDAGTTNLVLNERRSSLSAVWKHK